MLLLCGCAGAADPDSPVLDAGSGEGASADGGPSADASDEADRRTLQDGGADAGPDSPSDAPMDAEALPAYCKQGSTMPGWAEAKERARLVVHGPAVDIELSALEDGLLRLVYAAPDSSFVARSWAVLTQPTAAQDAVIGGTAKGVQLCTPEWVAETDSQGRISVIDADGFVLMEDGPTGGWSEGSEVVDGVMTATVAVTRATPSEESFFGFGERTGRLERRGQRMTFWNTDSYSNLYGGYPPDSDPLYMSVPFFLGLRNSKTYGVFTDNSHRLLMDMAATNPESYTIKAYGGSMVQYLIPGPSMRQVLRKYTRLVGRSELPPRWSLGYHQSRWGYSPANAVQQVAQEFRNRSIPADGIWLDIQHMDGFRTFTWDPAGFADPAGMIAELAKQGFKTVVIQDPGIKAEAGWGVYDTGLQGGHFLRQPNDDVYLGTAWPGLSAFPDYTSPAARLWWGDWVAKPVGLGVRGIWLDVNEPTTFPENGAGTVPNDLPIAGEGSVSTMAEGHNVYALQEARATWEGMVKSTPSRRPFLLSRAGYAGIQRYAATWTGDAPSSWESLRQTLPMLLNLGLSGISFVGSDVGGYSGHATPELFARWMSVGMVSPFFRGHVTTGVPSQEPWAFGLEVEDISRAFINRRYGLLPYLYSLFSEAAMEGTPILRPLVFEFQDDPTVYRIEDQAMLGPFMMVAPVLDAGVASRPVYLPAGRWYEEHSGAIFDGPALIDVGVTLAAMPTFIREGAIVATAPVMQWSDQKPVDPLALDLYPSTKPSSWTLYEDEGDGFAADKEGKSSRVVYTLQGNETGARLTAGPRVGTWKPAERTLRLRVRRVDHKPTAIRWNAALVGEFDSQEGLEGGNEGWWYDERDLSVLLVHADGDNFQVELTYDPAISELRPPVQVEFWVEVPPGTPTTTKVHVASSAWDWNQVPLEWIAASTAHGFAAAPRGEWFFYKYTRGDWGSVEKWSGCVEAANRYGLGEAHPARHDIVSTWRDWCP